MAAIEAFEQAQLSLLDFRRGRAALEVRHRLIAGDDTRALMYGGQKVGIPDLRARIRQQRRERHERRQVLVFSSEAVTDPRPDARTFERDRAGVNAQRRLEMVAVI